MMKYYDYAATTPLSDDMKDYIVSLLDDFGNPSSVYGIGLKNKNLIESARSEVMKFINAKYPEEIIFTSSGSASNSLAINGWKNPYRFHIYSPTSHKSMFKAGLYNNGIKLKVDKQGFIDLDNLEYVLDSVKLSGYKPMLSMEYANSEIGTVNDVKNIIQMVHRYNGLILLDCTGSISTIPVDVQELDVDMITFSGHKLRALKGVGILYRKKHIRLHPAVFGSQEFALFAGTENILGIASLGKALEKYSYDDKDSWRTQYLYENLKEELSKCNISCELVGANFERRLNNNLFLILKGVNGKKMVSLLDELHDIQISTGSACNNYVNTPSYVLTEIGIDDNYINDGIRITLSGKENKDELNELIEAILECALIIRTD